MRILSVLLLTAFRLCSQSPSAPTISINTAVPTPAWALLERKVLDANAAAARQFAAKYTKPNGELIHQPDLASPDAVPQNFWNWPLLYALGGDAGILPLWRRIWDAYLMQYSTHGAAGFLHLGLADPTDAKFDEFTRRFASLYPANTSLLANAWFLTGEAKFAEPLASPMDGILPDVLNAHITAPANPAYLNSLRVQLVNRMSSASKPGNPGWSILHFRGLTELYLNTFDSTDFAHLRDASAWSFSGDDDRAQKDYGHEADWLLYLNGKDPSFPERALQASLDRIRRFSARVRSDDSDPATWRSDHAHNYLPVTVEGLCQLMLGAPTPLWNAGLLHSAQVRYFDPIARRAGIPKDVAALVHGVNKDRVRVALMNTSFTEGRELIVQAGGYGEHTITTALLLPSPGVQAVPEPVSVNQRWVRVRLAPGAGGSLELGLRRNSARPALALPW
jgi:hypothetical protein